MIDLLDAVALSVVPRLSRLRLAAALRCFFPLPGTARDPTTSATASVTGHAGPDGAVETGPPPLDILLGWMGIDADARATARAARQAAANALRAAQASGVVAIGWGGTLYPPLLAAIPDPPAVVWVRGDPAVLTHPSIAVVGSRAASTYGREVAERLAADLAARRLTIVSGLARGIDSAAHRGALAGGGETVGVLGSGVDVVYPPEHDRLAAEIAGHGAIVSEFAPGTRPLAFHFPLRNRIISGLSLAVVVVEASERSGSLITANCALDQGREVMAVPGNVLHERHRGCHALLRDGARIVESAEDVVSELRLDFELPGSNGATASTAGQPEAPRGRAREDPILSALPAGEVHDLDAWSAASGLDPARMLVRLLELELRGAVCRAEGGWFVRPRRSC
jgi:DNA processing protein